MVFKKQWLFCVPLILILYYAYCKQFSCASTYPVTTIYSYTQVQDLFATCDAHTVILFDVDNTLITSPDIVTNYYEWPWWLKCMVYLRHPQLFNPVIGEQFNSIAWGQAPRELVESNVISMLQTLHSRACPIFALTTLETGSYGLIKSFPEWRYQMLRDMGIEFSQVCQDQEFTTLPSYRGTYPLVYKGILMTNHQEKGRVMDAFLKTCLLKPTHIIFFDDMMHNLQSVGKACQKLGIPCTLYHYLGSKPIAPWNTHDVLQRIDRIIACQCWVGPLYSMR